MADENIESRLCAYIDGLLNEQEREEIEKYLDRYPEHRKLIDELIRQRAVLRDLPRDKASGDVLSQYQNQLERSVLLGDLTESAGSGRSGRRRLNWAAIAAVILLAAGASVVVWIALPPKRGGEIATTLQNATPPAIGAIPGSVVPEVQPIAAATAPAPAPSAEVRATSAIQPLAMAAPAAMVPSPNNPPHAELIDTGNPERIILMIHSDDLQAARQRVQEYLQSKSLVPPAAPVASTQDSAKMTWSRDATDEAIVVDGMTRDQATELAKEFSNPRAPATAPVAPSVAPATTQIDITMGAPTTAPVPAATQTASVAATEPATRPQSEVTILFQIIAPVSASESPATRPAQPPTTEK